jgi:hypothetical protein
VEFAYKNSPRKKTAIKKNSTVRDREFGPLSLPSSFSASGFFLWVKFCRQTAASEFGQGHSPQVLNDLAPRMLLVLVNKKLHTTVANARHRALHACPSGMRGTEAAAVALAPGLSEPTE